MSRKSKAVQLGAWISAAALGSMAALPASLVQAQTATASNVTATTRYDIGAGPLAPALRSLASSAGIALTFTADQTDGKTTQGLQGEHALPQAFSTLLEGTGLQAVQLANGGYVLRALPQGSAITLPKMKITSDATPLPGEAPQAYAGGQVAQGSRLGMLGNLDIMQTPLSIVSFTDDFARNVQAKDITDVLRYDASIQTSTANSVSPRMIVRGFNLTKEQIGINGLYGIGNVDGFVDAQPFERAEIIKGPSSVLQGGVVNGGLGGSVSMVTKRAKDTPLTRITAIHETEDVWGMAVDAGRRFGDEGEWGVRTNVGYRNGTFADSRFDQEMTTGSLALDYRGERLRASLDYVGQRQYTEGTGFDCSRSLDADPALSSCVADDVWYETEQNFDLFIVALEYDLNEHWRVALKHGENRTDDTWPQTYPGASEPGDTTVELVNGVWAMSILPKSSEASLFGNFDTGAVTHDMVFSVSHYESKTWDSRNLGEEPTGVIVPVGSIPPRNLTNSPPDRGDLAFAARTSYTGYALVDRLSILDERYQLLLGARHQNVKSNTPAENDAYDESAVTPMVGLIYRPAPQWMVYGSYVEDLEQGTRVENDPAEPRYFINVGEVFEPTRNSQYEFGAKWDRGDLGATAALFQISQENGISVPVGIPDTYEYKIDGEQRNRGLELTLFGEPVTGNRLLAGYTYMDAELVDTEGGTDDGRAVMGVPDHRLVFNAEHDLRAVQGLTFTGTVTSVSSANRCISYLAPEDCGELPGYTLFDAGARYRFEAAGNPTTLRLTVQNLTDKAYFGVWSPGASDLVFSEGRTVSLSAEMDL